MDPVCVCHEREGDETLAQTRRTEDVYAHGCVNQSAFPLPRHLPSFGLSIMPFYANGSSFVWEQRDR